MAHSITASWLAGRRSLGFTHPQQVAMGMAGVPPGAIPSPRQRSGAAPARPGKKGSVTAGQRGRPGRVGFRSLPTTGTG